MDYKKFRMALLVRIGVLFAACAVFSLSVVHYKFHLITLLSGIFSFYVILRIIRYATRAHIELEKAFQSMIANDFSTRFSKKRTQEFPLLAWSNVIQHKLNEIKIVHEQKEIILNYAIDLLPVGILCVQDENDITLINKKTVEILDLNQSKHFKQMLRTHPELYQILIQLQDGQETKITIKTGHNNIELIITRSQIAVSNHNFSVYTFVPTNADFDQKETEAFKNLMRVLHHEIVNSITPIISLTDSVHQAIQQQPSTMTNDEISQAISAVLKRSKGLLKFSSGYRTLTETPQSQPTLIQPSELVQRTIQLLGDSLQHNIRYYTETRASIIADESQIEQVMINLLRNAIESIPEDTTPQIDILITEQTHELRISIRDNGIGMSDEVLANIFVPYFTTKKNGQGIGMSLCRQLVVANRGKIYIDSAPNEGTTIVLAFPLTSQ
jgi:two-component system nitrogen regulation sensor histidine kinase NtrY